MHLDTTDKIYITDTSVTLITGNPLGAMKALRKEDIFPD